MRGRDIIRAQDFNYLMLLGRGSFGKVEASQQLSYLLFTAFTGHAGGEEGDRRGLRHQDFKERHHHSGIFALETLF